MRRVVNPQTVLGQVDIATITFDPRSRDEIPKVLRGLQYIYCTPDVRAQVFEVLKEMVPVGVDMNNGRPGMDLWKILVLGAIRLNCNWDYDKLKEIADNHLTIRQMLGHPDFYDTYRYPIQTIEDNVKLFTPEILNKINDIVVHAGHNLVKKKADEELKARCDSFVVETDVHYPTDINLLFDAMRKIITLIGRLCEPLGIEGWRQSAHIIKKLKKLYRAAQRVKRSKASSEKRGQEKERRIREAHRRYTDESERYVEKARATIATMSLIGSVSEFAIVAAIENYIRHAERQIDQVRRRVLNGEKIPHEEKVFSIFEPHTEWISKGKAGVPQELGLKVCIVEDQHGFVLNHMVMSKTGDEQVAVPIVQETKQRYPTLGSCSFDKGFYSPENKSRLSKILRAVVLPKKGKPSREERKEEGKEEFFEARRQHAAVESGINALENHGLDRCVDKGLRGFRRYVALAVVARNLQVLGTILWKQEERRRKRKAPPGTRLCA